MNYTIRLECHEDVSTNPKSTIRHNEFYLLLKIETDAAQPERLYPCVAIILKHINSNPMLHTGRIVGTGYISLSSSTQSQPILAFPKNTRIWFAYEGHSTFELPGDFWFDEINSKKYDKSKEVFSTAINPCIIPVGIHQGKNIQMTYEFCHPTSATRQFGMGQLPISLFFTDKIQNRGEITSLLMMDRLLNLPGPPLGSINNIKLRMLRSATFDRWWIEWKKHLFDQSASMYLTDLFPKVVPQTTDFSPLHHSNSGVEIQYALGLLPNGGGLSPPVIGYNAPKTSTLLHGMPRVPIAPIAGKKRSKSATAPSAAKKKPKKQKATTYDLPAIDQDPPRPPTHVSESSENTPSAVGSHHIGEEEEEVIAPAPAIPILADMFSFDIRQFMDEEEETTSTALAPLADDVKTILLDISNRLEGSLETLVTSCGSIRDRLHEIDDKIPDELADAITPTAYLEQHRLKLEKAQKRIADRRERRDLEATIQANRASINKEKAKLDELEAGPSATQANIDRLNNQKIQLLAELEQCNAQLALEQAKLADLPKAIEDQKSKLKTSIKHLTELTKSLKPISSTDATDAQIIDEIDQIRQRAISAIQRYVSG
uniref:OSJNBa0094O15.9 protein n=1 Tax=Oryza sativa subsp. japonica TaxID=39947 RepID=Q7XXJ3_ORYSJ|nr:OSJNBa0094O15.9 [Oryza sativa Japonica Group]